MAKAVCALVASCVLYCTGALAQSIGPHDLPDPALTPGKANPTLTRSVICNPKWSTKSVRNVPQSLKLKVYRAYGMQKARTGYCNTKQGCEVDHLISLELGGANDIANLWPEPFQGTPLNAHTKDKYENYLHRRVCVGAISLKDAQGRIASDWVKGYRAAGLR